MSERTLGLTRTAPEQAPVSVPTPAVNSRVSLWPNRWPAIALQECIDAVEAAPLSERAQVKQALPCKDCPEAQRCLNAKRKELGPLMYDREIQTKPRSSESSLFPRELFEPMLNRDQVLVPYWHKPFGDEERYRVAQAWDLAWSERIGGDYLVCMTAYADLVTGKRHLLDIERWTRIEFDDQIKLIGAKWVAFSSDLVVIEADASQKIWSKHLQRNTSVPVLPHTAGGKGDLAAGVPGLLIMLENRRWEFPYGPPESYHRGEMENLLNEFEAFGWVDGKLQGVGEHDDTVMAFWHLNWGLDRLTLVQQPEQHRGVVPGRSL